MPRPGVRPAASDENTATVAGGDEDRCCPSATLPILAMARAPADVEREAEGGIRPAKALLSRPKPATRAE